VIKRRWDEGIKTYLSPAAVSDRAAQMTNAINAGTVVQAQFGTIYRDGVNYVVQNSRQTGKTSGSPPVFQEGSDAAVTLRQEGAPPLGTPLFLNSVPVTSGSRKQTLPSRLCCKTRAAILLKK
jgi:hypothetical protein